MSQKDVRIKEGKTKDTDVVSYPAIDGNYIPLQKKLNNIRGKIEKSSDISSLPTLLSPNEDDVRIFAEQVDANTFDMSTEEIKTKHGIKLNDEKLVGIQKKDEHDEKYMKFLSAVSKFIKVYNKLFKSLKKLSLAAVDKTKAMYNRFYALDSFHNKVRGKYTTYKGGDESKFKRTSSPLMPIPQLNQLVEEYKEALRLSGLEEFERETYLDEVIKEESGQKTVEFEKLQEVVVNVNGGPNTVKKISLKKEAENYNNSILLMVEEMFVGLKYAYEVIQVDATEREKREFNDGLINEFNALLTGLLDILTYDENTPVTVANVNALNMAGIKAKLDAVELKLTELKEHERLNDFVSTLNNLISSNDEKLGKVKVYKSKITDLLNTELETMSEETYLSKRDSLIQALDYDESSHVYSLPEKYTTDTEFVDLSGVPLTNINKLEQIVDTKVKVNKIKEEYEGLDPNQNFRGMSIGEIDAEITKFIEVKTKIEEAGLESKINELSNPTLTALHSDVKTRINTTVNILSELKTAKEAAVAARTIVNPILIKLAADTTSDKLSELSEVLNAVNTDKATLEEHKETIANANEDISDINTKLDSLRRDASVLMSKMDRIKNEANSIIATVEGQKSTLTPNEDLDTANTVSALDSRKHELENIVRLLNDYTAKLDKNILATEGYTEDNFNEKTDKLNELKSNLAAKLETANRVLGEIETKRVKINEEAETARLLAEFDTEYANRENFTVAEIIAIRNKYVKPGKASTSEANQNKAEEIAAKLTARIDTIAAKKDTVDSLDEEGITTLKGELKVFIGGSTYEEAKEDAANLDVTSNGDITSEEEQKINDVISAITTKEEGLETAIREEIRDMDPEALETIADKKYHELLAAETTATSKVSKLTELKEKLVELGETGAEADEKKQVYETKLQTIATRKEAIKNGITTAAEEHRDGGPHNEDYSTEDNIATLNTSQELTDKIDEIEGKVLKVQGYVTSIDDVLRKGFLDDHTNGHEDLNPEFNTVKTFREKMHTEYLASLQEVKRKAEAKKLVVDEFERFKGELEAIPTPELTELDNIDLDNPNWYGTMIQDINNAYSTLYNAIVTTKSHYNKFNDADGGNEEYNTFKSTYPELHAILVTITLNKVRPVLDKIRPVLSAETGKLKEMINNFSALWNARREPKHDFVQGSNEFNVFTTTSRSIASDMIEANLDSLLQYNRNVIGLIGTMGQYVQYYQSTAQKQQLKSMLEAMNDESNRDYSNLDRLRGVVNGLRPTKEELESKKALLDRDIEANSDENRYERANVAELLELDIINLFDAVEAKKAKEDAAANERERDEEIINKDISSFVSTPDTKLPRLRSNIAALKAHKVELEELKSKYSDDEDLIRRIDDKLQRLTIETDEGLLENNIRYMTSSAEKIETLLANPDSNITYNEEDSLETLKENKAKLEALVPEYEELLAEGQDNAPANDNRLKTNIIYADNDSESQELIQRISNGITNGDAKLNTIKEEIEKLSRAIEEKETPMETIESAMRIPIDIVSTSRVVEDHE